MISKVTGCRCVKLSDWGRRDERLIQAVNKGQLDRVKVLLNSGVDPAKIDPNTGLTAYVD